MRLLASGSLLLALAQAAQPATLHYEAPQDSPGSWPAIFSSIGLTPGKDGVAIAAPVRLKDGRRKDGRHVSSTARF